MRPQGEIHTLFSTEQINARIKELGDEIARDMDENLLAVAVLRGSFIFAADLIRQLGMSGLYPQVDFLTLSSYGHAKVSSGTVRVVHDVEAEIKGRDVLIIEDLVESGRTMSFAKNLMIERGAKNVKLCALLDKPGNRAVEVEAEYVGFECPPDFVIGYGLDAEGYFRDLPYIGVLEQDRVTT